MMFIALYLLLCPALALFPATPECRPDATKLRGVWKLEMTSGGITGDSIAPKEENILTITAARFKITTAGKVTVNAPYRLVCGKTIFSREPAEVLKVRGYGDFAVRQEEGRLHLSMNAHDGEQTTWARLKTK